MRAKVEASLLSAFRAEFHQDLAVLRREWEAYKPTRKTKLADLAELRRVLHTIKGSTRLLGFERLPEQVHELEELVLAALRKKQKPAGFWDGLADLEEAVARQLGEAEPSLEVAPESTAESQVVGGVEMGPVRAAPSSAYGFLLSVDELLTLSQELAAELQSLKAGSAAHQAVLLVERSRALREQARRMTLVPSSELFVGLTELARRTATERGKTVRVSYQVANDRLQRDIVLGLRPALLHLVANAVTHGIETASGEITFGYQRHPTQLVVTVRDNGPGLSREALKRAVVSAGHLSEKAWETTSEAEQLRWLFHPGLSTRSDADLSAGRGMGLAVVAETAERLGGSVEVESSAQGTQFHLLIPTNWNLRSVLRVRSGHRDFAVLSSELLGVESRSLDTSAGQRGGQVRELGELSVLLGYPGSFREGAYRLVLDKGESRPLAIGVDQLGEFEELLVTPLQGFSGLPAAMIGVAPYQGAPLPVLSLRGLLDAPLSLRTAPDAQATRADGPLLLVVDDSLTTRTLVTGILQSEGFRVLVAADGQQGLELARTEGLVGIVSDLQMPVLDGLGFLEKLREDPLTEALPFILLTSIDDVATFEKASGLGADRCLGKQNFSQDLLLKTLRELLPSGGTEG